MPHESHPLKEDLKVLNLITHLNDIYMHLTVISWARSRTGPSL